MLEFKVFSTRVKIHIFFIGISAVFLLLDKTKISSISILCSLLHESGHVLALYLCKNPPCELSFELTGIRLVKTDMSCKREVFVLLAGSLVNFMLSIVSGIVLVTAPNISMSGDILLFSLTNLTIGIINMLPVRGFDGGKIILLALDRAMPLEKSERAFSLIENIFIGVVVLISLWFYFKGIVNISVFIMCVYLILAK